MLQPDKMILLGEDDLDDQEILAEILNDLDSSFKLKPVNNGIFLLEYLKTLEDELLPVLILLDYNLPMANGAEILKTLGEESRYAKIPKLIWSTSSSQECIENCMYYGAAGYIIKPTDIQSMKERVLHILSYCKI